MTPGEVRRLLIVDDDPIFRERLALSMQRRGFDVRTAPDACTGARFAVEFQPEYAVVDLKMPDESGLWLLEKIRGALPGIRIVLLTGYGSIATAIEAIRSGAVDYLTKPIDAARIEAALTGVRPPSADSVASLDRVEWEHLQRVLQDCGNNISQAARLLRIDRRSLQRKLAKYPPAG